MVVRSTALNITSVSDAEVNGTVVLEWTKNVTSVTDTALTRDTVYFYNVLVKDEAENVAAYSVASQSTAADLTDPVPGDSGALSATDVAWTSFTLNWTEATDDISSSTDLHYKVYQSTSPDIATVEDAETNGMVVQDWTAGITSVSVTGLSPNTWYYMNVTVKDKADNTAVYGMNTHSALFEKIYWTDYAADKIQRANVDGSNVEDLITSGLLDPIGIATDVAGGKMYWTDYTARKIQQANLDGSNVMDLITTGSTCPQGIALDIAGGKMYWTIIDWTDIAADKIQRANLDGSNVEDLITTGLTAPREIALDVAGGKMYWTDPLSSTHKIQRANLDGSNVEDLITSGLHPVEIALDIASGKMYWADDLDGKIQRANLDGSNVEDLVTNLDDPFGIALDIAGGKMYWTDYGAHKIQRANMDGSNVEDLITNLNIPFGIALMLRP